MPPRRAKDMGLPAVNSPVLFDYSEQPAILLFGPLMKWLRPLIASSMRGQRAQEHNSVRPA